MKYLHLIILSLFLGSCQSDSHWVDDSNLHIKTENQIFTFSEEAKDSLLSIITQFKEDQGTKELFFTDLLGTSDLRYIPHPEIFEKFGNVLSDGNYRSILLTSSKDFPGDHFINDKYYNDNLYDAISFSTDSSGSNFFEMRYVAFDTLKVSYSEDFFPYQIFAQDIPQGFNNVEQQEKEISKSKSRRYQKKFYRLDEKSIFKNCHDDVIKYRISWFPSFDPPFSISVSSKDDKILLTGKRMIEAPYNNRLAANYIKTDILLSVMQWSNVMKKIDKLSFWELASIPDRYTVLNDSTLSYDVPGNDGARWLIEGCRFGEYHITDRWSHSVNEDYRALFNYLIQLAEFDEYVTKLY